MLAFQAQASAGRVTASLADELVALDRGLLPLLLPALQAYTRAAAAATSGAARTLPTSNWQAAEAAACADLLQTFVTAGSLAAAAGVCGRHAEAVLHGWMTGGGASAAAWQLLSQHVAGALRGADRAFLLTAVDRANAGMDATGASSINRSLWLRMLAWW